MKRILVKSCRFVMFLLLLRYSTILLNSSLLYEINLPKYIYVYLLYLNKETNNGQTVGLIYCGGTWLVGGIVMNKMTLKTKNTNKVKKKLIKNLQKYRNLTSSWNLGSIWPQSLSKAFIYKTVYHKIMCFYNSFWIPMPWPLEK